MAKIADEIKRSFEQGDALTKLIFVNIAVYVAYLLLRVLSYFTQVNIAGGFTDFVALPSDLLTLATRPWTLFTYMFLHQGFFHIFFNMLWLFFAGRLFVDYFGGRRLISTFLIGGLIGGASYVLFYNIFPAFYESVSISTNRGASAGVMAIVIGIATYNPKFPVRLFFVINVPLWGIAVGFLLLDLIGLGSGTGENAGGRIAHLGGAAFGFFMARAYRDGKDITEGFSQLGDKVASWFKPKPKVRKVYSNTASRSGSFSKNNRPSNKASDQRRMDEILDKISRSGYDSLSKDEKDHLFKIGKE
jgi:membrane associated rhomboid family serine protease